MKDNWSIIRNNFPKWLDYYDLITKVYKVKDEDLNKLLELERSLIEIEK